VLLEACLAGQLDTKAVIILQNAETVRLSSPTGEPQSVSEIGEGQRILLHVSRSNARHMGMAIEETIIEK